MDGALKVLMTFPALSRRVSVPEFALSKVQIPAPNPVLIGGTVEMGNVVGMRITTAVGVGGIVGKSTCVGREAGGGLLVAVTFFRGVILGCAAMLLCVGI